LIPGIWSSAYVKKLKRKKYKAKYIIDRIAVIVNLRFSIEHLANILSYLDISEYDLVYFGSSRLSYCLDYSKEHQSEIVSASDLIKNKTAYKLAMTMCCDNIVQQYGIELAAEKIIMIQTIITGDTPYSTDGISKLSYDYLVCCGNYQKRRI
jgi:hypothetical protein